MNVTTTLNTLNVKKEDISSKAPSNNDNAPKFSEELKNAKSKDESMATKETNDAKDTKEVKDSNESNIKGVSAKDKKLKEEETLKKVNENEKDETVDKISSLSGDNNPEIALNGLNDTIDALNKLNQKDEFKQEKIKNSYKNDDIKNKDEAADLIDNNVNLQEQLDKFNVQTGANMNFNSDGQQFSELVNKENSQKSINSSSKDLAEEKAIMSTMEENIAIANKNMAMSKTKTVENEQGIHKVDKKTNLVVDTIVNYNSVIMDKADVEFFANLVENGVLNMNEVTASEKSSRVSKTLADMLAKAMNDNKPIRIDFDNNISVIIKIDRAGKISADFLPSSQVAEAYLKENLPLLRQRFDDNNIDYNELNQRERKQDTQDNRKKDRKNE